MYGYLFPPLAPSASACVCAVIVLAIKLTTDTRKRKWNGNVVHDDKSKYGLFFDECVECALQFISQLIRRVRSSYQQQVVGYVGMCVQVRVCVCKCVCTAPITQMTTLTQLLFAICSTHLHTYTGRNQRKSGIWGRKLHRKFFINFNFNAGRTLGRGIRLVYSKKNQERTLSWNIWS